jgi:hypothetical protein
MLTIIHVTKTCSHISYSKWLEGRENSAKNSEMIMDIV